SSTAAERSPLCLHDALPICVLFCSGRIYYDLAEERRSLVAGQLDMKDLKGRTWKRKGDAQTAAATAIVRLEQLYPLDEKRLAGVDRKSTRLNSSHVSTSYAV